MKEQQEHSKWFIYRLQWLFLWSRSDIRKIQSSILQPPIEVSSQQCKNLSLKCHINTSSTFKQTGVTQPIQIKNCHICMKISRRLIFAWKYRFRCFIQYIESPHEFSSCILRQKSIHVKRNGFMLLRSLKFFEKIQLIIIIKLVKNNGQACYSIVLKALINLQQTVSQISERNR